jgi:hypothetical protein
MIQRPNVRARCYRLNLQTKSWRNRYGRRVRERYYRRCRWCRRPAIVSLAIWPMLCVNCGWRLSDMEPHIQYQHNPFSREA